MNLSDFGLTGGNREALHAPSPLLYRLETAVLEASTAPTRIDPTTLQMSRSPFT